jgi:hypothetical protein
MADSNKQESPVDLGALTDEQIATMSPDEVDKALQAVVSAGEGEPANEGSTPGVQDESQSAVAGEERDTDNAEAGGAASEYQSLGAQVNVAGSTSADQLEGRGNAEVFSDAADESGEDDQSSQAHGTAEDEGEVSDESDWQAKYEALDTQYQALMGEFKASGRTVKVESPDDARRLMQMGYDYTNKMREMKPHLKILKTLKHNNLLEPEKINFAIDLLSGKKEALAKFLKDNEVDPIDLDLEDSTPYEATDHQVSDEELELDEVLDSIRHTEAFKRTSHVITQEWDKRSQEVLMGIPSLIGALNSHIELGYYDKIVDKVRYERSLGRLRGLSDLDAYRTVGDAMEAQGVFGTPAGANNTRTVASRQTTSQDLSGSNDESEMDRRKRAASPTKGGAGAGNAQPVKNYLGDFTDEEIAAM